MGFVINDFGTLKNVTKDERLVKITNTSNQSLVMSRVNIKNLLIEFILKHKVLLVKKLEYKQVRIC